jgi:rhamnulokinase
MNLAFDLGATSWRAMLADDRGGLEEVYRSVNQPIQRDGGLFWDVEKIFSQMKEVLREVAGRGIMLDSIGIDSWNVDYALLDEGGRMLETPRCYRDPRNTGMLDRLAGMTDLEEVFGRTGTMAEDITTLCQLLAAKRETPDLLKKARRLLFIPDLLRYWLCGEMATDYTLASTSQLYHVNLRSWDVELMTRLGLPVDLLPPIQYGCSILGRLSDEVQKETGQRAVAVTTGASHDTAAAFFAAGADRDSVIISSGTWSVLGVNLDSPLPAGSVNPREFGYEGNVNGSIRLIQNVPGMYLLEQCRREWEGQSYDQIIEEARNCESFSTRINPFCPDFGNPPSMTEAINLYCRQTGQPVPQRPGEYARAIFQGLAEGYAKAIEKLRAMAGREYKTLIVVGGGSRNELLNELTAAAAKVAVVRGPVEASATGNIRCQEQALAG